MEDSRRLAEKIVIRLNRHGAGLSNLAIGYVMEVIEMDKNLAQPDVSGEFSLRSETEKVLTDITRIYMDVNDDGEPNAPLMEIVDAWGELNKLLVKLRSENFR